MLGFHGINNLCHALEELLISARSSGTVDSRIVDLIFEARRSIEELLSISPEATTEDGSPLPWLTDLHRRLKQAAEAGPSTPDEIKSPKVEHIEEPAKRHQPLFPGSTSSWRESTVRVNVDAIDDILLFGRELSQALEGLNRVQLDIDSVRTKLENRLNPQFGDYTNIDSLYTDDTETERELNRITVLLRERIADVDRHVRQIDSGAVELRMRPIEELYETLPLQVRDLSNTLKKDVNITMTGADVRLDGRIIEMLGEPLIHIIRNCVDHGIEDPEEREAIGKSTQGNIFISSSENGGWARIMIADDGRGIDLDRIWNRAVELGLTHSDKPTQAEIEDRYKYLFNDRFTSRKGASDISGRGVGLAAVKKRLQDLRGNVTIESEVGLGTRFVLTIPTSLSSQRTLVTIVKHPEHGGLFLGFPTAMVRGTSNRSMEMSCQINAKEEIKSSSNGKTISLAKLLIENDMTEAQPDEQYIVEVDDGVRSMAFSVNQIVAETQTIIEPLPTIAQSAELITGAAPITPEQIMLIINVPAVLSRQYIQTEVVNK